MKIAIIGSRGRVGGALVRLWQDRHEIATFARPDIDLRDPSTLDAALGERKFDWVVNCAAQANVDACERLPEEARVINTIAPYRMAEHCARTGARFIHLSTDYVFDGRQREPYAEESKPSPLSVYGLTKADAEALVLATLPEAIVARISWVFGPEKPSFVDLILGRALAHDDVAAIGDKWSTPTYTADLAGWLDGLIGLDAPGGMYHLCNSGACTWREYGEHALRCAADLGLPVKTTSVRAQSLAEMDAFVAERPVYTVMSTERASKTLGVPPRPWQDAVADYIRAHPPC